MVRGKRLIAYCGRRVFRPDEVQALNGERPSTTYRFYVSAAPAQIHSTNGWSKWTKAVPLGNITVRVEQKVAGSVGINEQGAYRTTAQNALLIAPVECNDVPDDQSRNSEPGDIVQRLAALPPAQQMETLRSLAEQNDRVALWMLAARYWRGQWGGPPDKAKAIAVLERGAMAGSLSSMYNYGVALRDGILRPKDLANGLALIRKAADAGYVPAMLAIGEADRAGTDVPKNPATALH